VEHGSDIMRHTAMPMIGGMVSSTPLALIVTRAIFGPVNSSGLPPTGEAPLSANTKAV
jgi:Cu/Ag efflux pump CusA